jgi:hypothetical protein
MIKTKENDKGILCTINHLGRNPIKGGKPPKDIRETKNGI